MASFQNSNKFFYLALAAVMPTLCLSSVIPEGSGLDVFKSNGFQYIGSLNKLGKAEKAGVNVAAGTDSISLWLSPENFKETQYAAITKCNRLGADLLFIFTQSQYEVVQQVILGLGEPVWTSALYDEGLNTFGWFINGAPVERKYLRSESRCMESYPGRGLAVQGMMSSYGLCSTRSDTSLRYICAF